MFDIGFLEIIVVLIIALVVIGPERMPEVARKVGQFISKTRNFINSVKDDSSMRDTIRELQGALDLKEEQQRFTNIQQDLYKGFDDVRDEINFDELQRPFANTEPTKADDKPTESAQDLGAENLQPEVASDSLASSDQTTQSPSALTTAPTDSLTK